MPKARLMAIQSHADARGALGVIEGAAMPFDVQRVYYLYAVPLGAIRGEHAHRRLEQLIVCMHGLVELTFNDGVNQQVFKLDSPAQAVHVTPGLWRSLRFLEPGTVVCVFASHPYQTDDYIYSFEEYLDWVKAGRPLDGSAPDTATPEPP